MRVRLAIARRRMKKLAAGVMAYDRRMRHGWLMLYAVVDDKVAPFVMLGFHWVNETLQEAGETLQVKKLDWVRVEASEVERYIFEHARNR